MVNIFAIVFLIFLVITFIVIGSMILFAFAKVAFSPRPARQDKYFDDWNDDTLEYSVVRGKVRLDKF